MSLSHVGLYSESQWRFSQWTSDSPGGSKRCAGEVELSCLKGDEERTLGGELFTPVGKSSAGQSQRLLEAETHSDQHPSHAPSSINCKLHLHAAGLLNPLHSGQEVCSNTDLDLLQDLGCDLLTGELLWRRIELQLVEICTSRQTELIPN